MELWDREAWSCPQVNRVGIGQREPLRNTASGARNVPAPQSLFLSLNPNPTGL